MPLWAFAGAAKHASVGKALRSPARTERLVYLKSGCRSPLVNRKCIIPGTLAGVGAVQPCTTELDWTRHYGGRSQHVPMAAEPSGQEDGVGIASKKPQIVSVDEYLIAAGGQGVFQNRLFATMSLLYACVAFDAMLAAFLAPALGARWGLTVAQQGLIPSSWFVGGLIGFALSGLFADTLGRRPTMLALSVVRCFGDVLTFTAPSLPWLLTSRILAAAGTMGAFNMIYPLLAELSPPEERAAIKRRTGLVWQCAVVVLVAMAYLLRSFPWQAFSAVLLPASFLAVVWLFRGLPESPRFLLVKGRHLQALALLRAVALCNGRLHACDHLRLATSHIEDCESGTGGKATPRGNLATLFVREQSGRTIALLIFNLVASCTYYGLTFAPVASLGSNAYLSQLSAALLEIPAILLVAPLANKLGRRPALIGLLGVFAGAILALAMMSHSAMQLRLGAMLIGRMSGSAFNTLKWVANAENFPTAVRGAGLAAAGLSGMLGGSLGPVIFTLAPSPFLVLSSLCLLGIFAVWTLPETNGTELD